MMILARDCNAPDTTREVFLQRKHWSKQEAGLTMSALAAAVEEEGRQTGTAKVGGTAGMAAGMPPLAAC